jgi:TerC family integral membrane protein
MLTLFPLGVWLVTIAGLVLVVVVDLAVIGRRRRAVTVRHAVLSVVGYVALAGLFALALWHYHPGPAAGQFTAAYLTEYVLSVDNLFVFMLIMARFAVPREAQDKALYIGIVGSMVLRAVFILAGTGALALTNDVFYLFGAILVYTAFRVGFGGDEPVEVKDNGIVRAIGRIIPTTPGYQGARIFTGTWRRPRATPLLVVIASISVANVIFAADSLPAAFGLTQDAYIIITANAFALMGLRQLFFVIGGLLDRLVYLNYGLAVVLAFIGVRLVFEALRTSHVDHIGPVPVPAVGIGTSLLVIVGVLAATAVLSLTVPRLRRTAPPAPERTPVPARRDPS